MNTAISTPCKLTVVMPVLNRRHIVARTLDSIKSQDYRPLHLIIVDNGSTDGTFETVSKWAEGNSEPQFQVTVVQHTEGGACGARNHGLTLVEGEYVVFFDSDDVMLPSHLSRIAAELEKFPQTDILYFDIAFVDSDGWLTVKRADDDNLMRSHLLHGVLSTQRIAVRTSLVRDAGGWNPNCQRWNDLEIGARMLLRQPVCRKLTGEPTVHIYHTEHSITGKGYYDEGHRCEHTLDSITAIMAPAGRPLECQWIDCRRAVLAAMYAREGHADEAARLMRKLLEKCSVADALKLRAIHMTTRIFGHGGTLLATLLYAPQRPKRPNGRRR